MIEKLGFFAPRTLFWAFSEEFSYLGIEAKRETVGAMVFACALLSIMIGAGALALAGLAPIFFIPIALASFGIILLGTFAWLRMASESRGKLVEKILPDALQLIASNMKSGMTTEKALLVSARDEFGPLAIELKNASKKILAGQKMEEALLGVPKKIRSKTLDRTIWLISKGASSGGQMADLLLRLGEDLRLQLSIEEETNANISMYLMLIFFASAIGGPALMGISTFIVQIMGKQAGGISGSAFSGGQENILAQSKVNFTIAPPSEMVSVDFIIMYCALITIIGAIFAAMTLGIISNGKELSGLRYLPVILIMGLIVFFATRIALLAVFGNIA